MHLKHKNTLAILTAALLTCLPAAAQNDSKSIQLHGSIQTEFLVPESDEKIGTEKTSEDLQNNTYIDLSLSSKYVDAGARLEYLEHPLPGFERDFKGWGVPHIYVKGKINGAELTVGDIYEQFGSGFILRAYEERSLGVDNSIRGARVKVSAIDGVRLTALGGVQRRYWEWNKNSVLGGADAEIDLDHFIPSMAKNDMTWMLGASWVLKNEKLPPADAPLFIPGTAYYLNMPKNVNAFDIRTQLHKSNVTVLAEYAWKTEDPSHDNGYTFHKGSAAMLSASYSKSGFSALVQAKRSEDMAFRSQRAMTGTSAFINYMPAFAYQHTYALAALYPYATQYCNISENATTMIPGEWAFQGELAYNFKRKTAIGGKYGTKVKLNFSQVRALDVKPGKLYEGYTYGAEAYSTSFFGMKGKYYQDLNIQIEKKFSKEFKLNFMWMNQEYNQPIIENHGHVLKSNIFVADGRYQFSKDMTLRVEAQYLLSGSDKGLEENEKSGDWIYGLAELTVLPHFMFTVSDQYGKPYFADGYHDKEHYYMASATYTNGAHRVNLGYGRTRAGYNCSGGVCRWVPASKGIQLSYNYTF